MVAFPIQTTAKTHTHTHTHTQMDVDELQSLVNSGLENGDGVDMKSFDQILSLSDALLLKDVLTDVSHLCFSRVS